ncbi:SAM-dependent methyltransferase [Amycolatopsis kentuckyensis]|uniref:SAM-dependent methyltransferase n=1 Tax=Amycolatopsis kentuckyensis TaxID=218823 RepID=UPI000A371390|nr:SAM-dependent methyltransferase [Amycolatopsis kentuckyensis]
MIVDATSYAIQSRARLWNAMLEGNEAYETDRFLLAHLLHVAPDIRRIALNERSFIHRFWRFVTGIRGISQVVHVGAPLAAGAPPHRELACPGRVVYVEGDELLAAKGAAWLADRYADVVFIDPADPAGVVDAVSGRIDWDEPVAVIAPNFLHWLDEGRARTWVIEVAEQLVEGSFLAATHLRDPELPELVVLIERLINLLDGRVGAGFFRRHAKIESLFPGMALEHPGVIPAVDWWPNGPRLDKPSPADQLLAGVVATIPRVT